MSRGVGPIKKKVWKIVSGHRRYVGLDAKGRWKFLKHPSKSKSSKSSKTKTKKKKVKKMGKKKRRRYSMTIPLAPMIGLVAGIAGPPIGYSVGAIDYLVKGDVSHAIGCWKLNFLGLDDAGNFRFDALSRGLLPLVAGLLVHKFVGGPPLNLNRILGRAKVPFIRI